MTAPAETPLRPIAADPGRRPRSAVRGAVALTARRLLVVAGMAASITLGALTINAAAAWTASSAPLAAPVSVTDVSAKLAQEEARSAALERQIAGLNTRTAELTQALDTAQQHVASGTAAAISLQTKLAAAQHRLAALTKALRAGAAARVTTAPAPVSAATSGTVTGSGAGGSELEQGGDD